MDYTIQFLDGLPGLYFHAAAGLLTECDSEFIPPLSVRTGTVQFDFTDMRRNGGVERCLSDMEGQETIVALDEKDGHILGLLSFIDRKMPIDDMSSRLVTTLCVAPHARRHGIAKALVNGAESTSSYKRVTTYMASTDIASLTLFRSLGYTDSYVVHEGVATGVDCIHMSKSLCA